MGPTWVLSATDGPHVGPMNLAIRVPILVIHIRSQVKTRQGQIYKFKKTAKILILQESYHATHRLEWLDKM